MGTRIGAIIISALWGLDMANVVCINGKNPNGRLLFLTSPDMSASNVSELVDVVSSTSLVDESSMIIVASY